MFAVRTLKYSNFYFYFFYFFDIYVLFFHYLLIFLTFLFLFLIFFLLFFEDFESLIPGQGWLVRNGKSYIEENLSKIGDNEDFTISIKETLHTVKTTDIAPRSVIGYDKDGKLLLLQIDGQVQHKGINQDRLRLMYF